MKDRKNSSLLRRLEKFQRLFFVALLSVLAKLLWTIQFMTPLTPDLVSSFS